MLDLEQRWSSEFASRAGRHASVQIGAVVELTEQEKVSLGRSLATFQLGETGSGEHVLTAARESGVSTDYYDALRAFLDEEHEHARLLALILDAIDQPLLEDHWSDRAFVYIRRIKSIHSQVLTLLVAELVAVPYYRSLRDGTGSDQLATVFGHIHADEARHVDFHAETLPALMQGWSAPVRWLVRAFWNSLVATTSVIVAFEHGAALRVAGVRRRRFVADVWRLRRDVDRRLFG